MQRFVLRAVSVCGLFSETSKSLSPTNQRVCRMHIRAEQAFRRGANVGRLAQRFALLRERGEKALICFVTAGDPSEERTVEIIKTLAQAGVDAVEIGIPFSDPLADGPSIQASSQRALEGGMTTAKALAIVRAVREATPELPLIL